MATRVRRLPKFMKILEKIEGIYMDYACLFHGQWAQMHFETLVLQNLEPLGKLEARKKALLIGI